MQPYFFPYIGYWQMINVVDKYVIYDDVNFIKGGWVNRNRILVAGRAQFIHIPTIHASPNKLIFEINLSNDLSKREKLLSTLSMCYSKAPYFDDIMPMLQNIILFEENNLARFLEYTIRRVCNFLNIKTEIIISSTLEKNNSLRGKEKVFEICRNLHATNYYNAIGGQSLYDYAEFERQNLELKFLKTNDIVYKQFKNEFIPNLSIIDVLMFNSKDEVIRMLDMFTLV